MKPIYAIIVTYRRLDRLRETVYSLMPTIPQESRLVIVNNDPYGAETREFMRTLPWYTHQFSVDFHGVHLDENVGWGAAMNEGLRSAPQWRHFEYVLESNNDVTYERHWCAMAQTAMVTYPEIGILGLWKHPYHGVRRELPDGILIKDDMPATAWFMRSRDLGEFLPFPEHGPAKTRGGNGEDVAFRDKVQNKLGRWICGPKEDWAHHMDGYDIPDLGKVNPAYE